MASPFKASLYTDRSGTSVSYIPWGDPNKTVVSGGHVLFYRKELTSESLDSDGVIATPLYREYFKAGPGTVRIKDRNQKIVDGEYIYTWARSTQRVFPAGSIYDRSFIPGFSPLYTDKTGRSLSGFDSAALAGCNRRILAKLGKASFDIGIVLVEMQDTVNWISKRSGQLASGLIAAKNGQLPKMGRILGFNPRKLKNWNIFRRMGKNPAADLVSQLILETNFAIKPLLSDIEDGVNLFRDPTHNIFYGGARAASATVHDLANYWPYRQRNYVEKGADTHRMSVSFRIVDPDLIARKALGLATNPATAWEGVPYSWLIDYVVDVGGFLAATVATQGLSFVTGTESRKLNLSTLITKEIEVPSLSNYARDRCVYTGEFYNRRVMTEFPTPSLEFVFKDLTITKALNVVALGQQLRR